ncbi:MAG: xylosidase, partial [Bacilli bacterium]|nr:xylosidase [Bacilli bacterium]
MNKQCYNPYLPGWEYIPDGEPKVFGDRLYIFGSHDR